MNTFLIFLLVFTSFIICYSQISTALIPCDPGHYRTASLLSVAQGEATGESIEIGAMAVDALGNTYIIGSIAGSISFGSDEWKLDSESSSRQIFIFKLNSTTNQVVWSKSIKSTKDEIHGSDILVDSNGDVYIAGYFNVDVDFGSGWSFSYSSDIGVFIAKLDSLGDIQWVNSTNFHNTEEKIQYSFKFAMDPDDPDGGLFVSGQFNDIIQLGSFRLESLVETIMFIAKYDTDSGYVQWAEKFDQRLQPNGIALDLPRDAIYVTGKNHESFFVAKFDSNNGGNQWFVKTEDKGTGHDIALDINGDIYITGEFVNTIAFSPTFSLQSTGGVFSFYTFIAKFNSTGQVQWATNMVNAGRGNSIAVNPSGTSVYIVGEVFLSNYISDFLVAKYDIQENIPIVEWIIHAEGDSKSGAKSIFLDPVHMDVLHVVGTFIESVVFDAISGPFLKTNNGAFVAKYNTTSTAQCPVGTYSEDCQSTCTACPSGTFQNVLGATSKADCKECHAGTYAVSNSTFSECVSCPSGYFSNNTGSTECAPCVAGTYQNAEGQSECIACSKGFFQNEIGQSSCKKCDAGSYQNTTGQETCLLCETGTYQSAQGQQHCDSCPAGTYLEKLGAEDINSCIPCSNGTFSSIHGAGNSTACQLCAPGYFSDISGASSCTACPPGTYQHESGSKECIPCSFGTYSSIPGRSEACEVCDGVDQFCSVGSSIPISSIFRTNATLTMDPFFSTLSKRTSEKQSTLNIARLVAVLVCMCIIVFQFFLMVFACVILPHAIKKKRRLPVRLDEWMSKIDVFPKKHWVPMKATLVKRKTFLGGLCTIIFLVLILTIVALTMTEFFTINQFERMTIVAENLLTKDFSSNVDTRVVGDYFFDFTFHNFMDPNCIVTSYRINGLISTNGTKSNNNEVEGAVRFRATRNDTTAACAFQVNCTNCYLSSVNPSVTLNMGHDLAMASSISYRLQLPHFYENSNLTVEQIIAPSDNRFVLKGPQPTLIPLSLTKTLYSRLSDDFFVFSLFSEVLRIAPQWNNPTTIGYSVVHSPIELGSLADESNFRTQEGGISLQLLLQINPNALLIEQESKYSSLDLLSKTGALVSSMAVIVVILMNCMEEHCLHSLLPKAKSHMSQKRNSKKSSDADGDEPGDKNESHGNEAQEMEMKDLEATLPIPDPYSPSMHSSSKELVKLRAMMRELHSMLEEQAQRFGSAIDDLQRQQISSKEKSD